MTRKHTHMYHKVYDGGGMTINGRVVKGRFTWGCALPDCTHFMPHNVAHMVAGKASLCNGCMDVFTLNAENMKRDKPLCNNCINPDNTINIPEEYDVEREQTRSFVAGKFHKPKDEVTDAEIEMYIHLFR